MGNYLHSMVELSPNGKIELPEQLLKGKDWQPGQIFALEVKGNAIVMEPRGGLSLDSDKNFPENKKASSSSDEPPQNPLDARGTEAISYEEMSRLNSSELEKMLASDPAHGVRENPYDVWAAEDPLIAEFLRICRASKVEFKRDKN